jgi:hypothetical protein
LKNYWRRVISPKKHFEEQLQDIRHPAHDKIKHRKRLQEDKEFDKYLEEELKKLNEEDDTF